MTRSQSRSIHSVVHWIALSTLGLSFIATACYAETCGIDLISADGFETITNYPALSSLPQALSSPGTAASIDGATLSATITYPTAGANLSTPSTQVVGTFSGPTNTGLVINGKSPSPKTESF